MTGLSRLRAVRGDLDYPNFEENGHVRKSGLLPVADKNTEILILGTLPSDKSLAAGQYYANPGNDFWKLVGAALNQPFEDLPYEAKIELLKANRIGLWDAYHSCIRPGSMDGDISEQEPNDFASLRSLAPNIKLIYFNGQGASEASESLNRLKYRTALLPSSSGANRNNQGARVSRWKEAIEFIATDFNKKYALTPEPILEDAEILSPDGLSSMFIRVDTGQMPSLKDVQTALASILLIPQVPESVDWTFRIAKRLYLFARFEYEFYTVSLHYASLAMEAAILTRWTASLPNPVTSHWNGLRQQISAPSHGELAKVFWSKNGRSLTVDGLPFPNSLTKVLRRLRETGIIDTLTEKDILEVIGLRNDLSHQESSIVLPPSTGSLSVVAEQINALFDSVPYKP